MPRCAICDYTTQSGSALLNKPPNGKVTVAWSTKQSEFLCSDCARSIRTQEIEHTFREA